MREFKFRGKSTKTGEWVYGCLTLKTGSPRIAFYNSVGYWIEVEVISETISQYTNLKDNNGKDIYEGDILKSFTEEPTKGKVFYSDGCYCLTSDFESSINDESIYDVLDKNLILDNHLEVIGNIYENHELLQ